MRPDDRALASKISIGKGCLKSQEQAGEHMVDPRAQPKSSERDALYTSPDPRTEWWERLIPRAVAPVSIFMFSPFFWNPPAWVILMMYPPTASFTRLAFVLTHPWAPVRNREEHNQRAHAYSKAAADAPANDNTADAGAATENVAVANNSRPKPRGSLAGTPARDINGIGSGSACVSIGLGQ